MHDKEHNGTSNGHGTGLRLQQASLRMRRSRKTHIPVATTREACKPRIQASPLRSKPDAKQSHGSGSAHKAAMTLNITSLAKGLQQQRRTHNKHKLETQCTRLTAVQEQWPWRAHACNATMKQDKGHDKQAFIAGKKDAAVCPPA